MNDAIGTETFHFRSDVRRKGMIRSCRRAPKETLRIQGVPWVVA